MRVAMNEPGSPTRSILVIRLGAVGDVVRTLPAVSCLRRSFPSARIAWAVEEPSSGILEGHPDIDEILVLRRKVLVAALNLRGISGAITHLRAYTAALRERRFDWAVDFHGTIKSALLARWSGAPRRFGFGRDHAREHAHILYTDTAPIPRERMSRVTRALRLVAHLGAEISSPRIRLPVREEASASARRFLDAEAPARPRTVICPGTSETQAYKRYPARLFARLADEVAAGTGGSVIIAWGPGEKETAEEVRRSMSRPSILAPPTRLSELAELTRQCDLFVGSDTGPLHIAAAVGVRIVGLYGPTSRTLNAPYTDQPHLMFVGDVDCRPCRNRGCTNRSCLHLIDPVMVARRAVDLLGTSMAGTPGLRGGSGSVP